MIKDKIALILFLKEVGGLNESFYTRANKSLKKAINPFKIDANPFLETTSAPYSLKA